MKRKSFSFVEGCGSRVGGRRTLPLICGLVVPILSVQNPALRALGRLPVLRLRPSSSWRNRAPLSPEEIRHTERWLATARVFLAVSALVAVWMDPGELTS